MYCHHTQTPHTTPRNAQEGKAQGKSGAEAGHIPFRNSRLTYLLQDAFGADNKALMIVQVSPDPVRACFPFLVCGRGGVWLLLVAAATGGIVLHTYPRTISLLHTHMSTHTHTCTCPQEDAAESLCSLTFAQRVNGVSLSGAAAGQKGGGKGGDAKNMRQVILQARGEAREAEAARWDFCGGVVASLVRPFVNVFIYHIPPSLRTH